MPTTSTTYRTEEAPVHDTTADLADILRTIASGLTAGMPEWTALDHATHDPGVIRMHLRTGDDVQQWAVWLLQRWAVAADSRNVTGDTYTRHSRMAHAYGLTVELFCLVRVERLPPDAARALMAALPPAAVEVRP